LWGGCTRTGEFDNKHLGSASSPSRLSESTDRDCTDHGFDQWSADKNRRREDTGVVTIRFSTQGDSGGGVALSLFPSPNINDRMLGRFAAEFETGELQSCCTNKRREGAQFDFSGLGSGWKLTISFRLTERKKVRNLFTLKGLRLKSLRVKKVRFGACTRPQCAPHDIGPCIEMSAANSAPPNRI